MQELETYTEILASRKPAVHVKDTRFQFNLINLFIKQLTCIDTIKQNKIRAVDRRRQELKVVYTATLLYLTIVYNVM